MGKVIALTPNDPISQGDQLAALTGPSPIPCTYMQVLVNNCMLLLQCDSPLVGNSQNTQVAFVVVRFPSCKFCKQCKQLLMSNECVRLPGKTVQ